ncbi:MerR family transcriptional regulator [Acidipropionibacterium jensenii]|uniref:heat shock protein transcriptional repressor HspR n=1 Tax=Acidipropionibacterium jensenii TaxID=1749 RepID=UPI000BC2EB52|nr:helix-turn-helix transcriptional regulator [Acidipropionibacterium jensenii]AZZ41469.1 MerR family transcriptional regulator [Acidipropionibacterium jensenii]
MARRAKVLAEGTDLAPIDEDAAIFPISVAAGLAGMHPQTLRGYDRLGLVVPSRAKSRGRRYTARDITRLRLVQHLSQEEGINLSGIRRILELETRIDRLNEQIDQLTDTVRRMQDAEYHGNADLPRVFTAESTGLVHMGRTIVRAQLALPSR